MQHDAIVIGAGPNGLVCANRLVDAGWDVLVLEAEPEIGGAVRSARDVHPEFVHDTFSAFYPLAALSRPLQSMQLERHGLRWVNAPAVLGHPRHDGSWALLHPDPSVTATLMDADHPGDGELWHSVCDRWRTIGPALLDALLSPFPPLRGGLATLLKLPRVGGLGYLRGLLKPATSMATEFGGDAAKLLLAGNACHADIPLDAAGSGLMGLLITMLGQTAGFPVPEGGAGKLTAALADRLTSRGGRIQCDARATSIEVRNGAAVAVHCGAERFEARRAVIADVGAEQLYGGLVSWGDLPTKTHADMQRFERDPGTVKVDWALSGPVPWAQPPAYAPGTVHIGGTVPEMVTALSQVTAGAVPDKPMLLVGQMTTTDPSRSPAGTESLWAYTHVPQRILASEDGITGSWDPSDAERMADKMQARIEAHAPGFASRILTRRVLTPRDLEARNANLVGGSLNGGTAALHQQLIFRPIPGNARATTPVAGLFLGSASAHPGGGVHGACGMNAARAALVHARLHRAH